MFGRIVGSHGNECTDADMERELHDLDSLVSQPLEHRFSEVQPGRRRCNGARNSGINGLVLRRVRRSITSYEVGWKRHLPVCLKELLNRSAGMKHTQTMWTAFSEDAFEFSFGKNDSITFSNSLARPAQDFP